MGALVSGAVLLPAAPALADVNVSTRGFELKPGESREITVAVTGNDADDPQVTITVSNELAGELTLSGCGENGRTVLDCNADDFTGNGAIKQTKITAAQKNPSGLQPNQNRQGNIAVESGNQNANINVRVTGPEQAASVTEVSGKVVNQSTGEGVANAQVSLKDSANNEHNATANGRGEFRITPQGGKPIAAGQLTLTATFEGFADGTKTANGVAGKATNGVEIRMKPTAASAPPSAPVASDTTPAEEASPGVSGIANPSNTAGDSEGPSLLSWLLIGMGVVLVLLGVGAIVLLMMRRKDDGDDADDYVDGGPNPMAPVGAAAGGYRGSDRTMVAGSPGMNDATAIVGPQQPLDEFPDPYAAPAPTRVGYTGGAYNGADQATNIAPSPGYGRGGGYGDEAGYGRGEPGYNGGGGNGYDRGGYEPQRGGGYDDQRGGYGGAGGNGYGGGGGYGDAPRGRYDDQPTGHYQAGGGYPAAGGFAGGGAAPGGPANGYGPGGGHGGPANGYGGGHGGYDEGGRGGDYGRGGGYPSAGGYERQPTEYDRGGDPRNGRGGGRSVDWLD